MDYNLEEKLSNQLLNRLVYCEDLEQALSIMKKMNMSETLIAIKVETFSKGEQALGSSVAAAAPNVEPPSAAASKARKKKLRAQEKKQQQQLLQATSSQQLLQAASSQLQQQLPDSSAVDTIVKQTLDMAKFVKYLHKVLTGRVVLGQVRADISDKAEAIEDPLRLERLDITGNEEATSS